MYRCALEGGVKKIFYRAVRVLLAYMSFVRISMFWVNGVCMGMQVQYKRIGYHYSGKEQQQ